MSSRPNPQLELTSGSGPASFPQTGSWNMLDLAKLPIQVTLEALSRYSAARVNPYTALVGEVLCQNFQLSVLGRSNLEQAINNLKVVGSLGNTLEFGFGIVDVIRSMAKSERGCIFLGLCAALRECYSNEMAVDILLEMARLVNVDGYYMPSSQSWKEMLDACSGALSTSKFPRLAEHLMRLPASERRLGPSSPKLYSEGPGFRGVSSAKSIAEVLYALSRISKHEMQAITVIGGADAGWLAAFAEWFLGLKVLMTKSDGTILYTNSGTEEIQLQVIIQYGAQGVPQALQSFGRTYQLENVSSLIKIEQKSEGIVSGRVEWDNVFEYTFGSDFKNLMSARETVGELLGSAAVLFRGLAEADSMFAPKYRIANTSYCDTSYGSGLITNTLQWFPELQTLKESMQSALSGDLRTARRSYEVCMSTLRGRCDCSTCSKPWSGYDSNPDNSSFKVPYSSEEICQVVLAETIIRLSRTLSNLVLEDRRLLPTRSGMDLAYAQQYDHRQSSRLETKILQDVGLIAYCLDLSKVFDSEFDYGLKADNYEGMQKPLKTALELFSGRQVSQSSLGISAMCCNGVCAFLGTLQEPSEDRSMVTRIHIIPGRIYHERKNYTRLVDRVKSAGMVAPDYNFTDKMAEIPNRHWKTSLSVRESSISLECLLEMSSDDPQPERLQIGPSHLSELLASTRGLVSCKVSKQAMHKIRICCCPGNSLKVKEEDIEILTSMGRLSLKVGQRSVIMWRNPESLHSIIALALIASSASSTIL
jgi:hypothetical protein